MLGLGLGLLLIEEPSKLPSLSTEYCLTVLSRNSLNSRSGDLVLSSADLLFSRLCLFGSVFSAMSSRLFMSPCDDDIGVIIIIDGACKGRCSACSAWRLMDKT